MDTAKNRALLDFYRLMGYDVVGLGTRELGASLAFWQTELQRGLPLVAANLYSSHWTKPSVLSDAVGYMPLFPPYRIIEREGTRIAVLGLISEMAWRAHRDSTDGVTWVSPFAMGDVVREAAAKSDQLTVLGDFNTQGAESLVTAFPEIDLFIGSGIRHDQLVRKGGALITGAQSRGNAANFVQFNYLQPDSVQFTNKSQVLDESVPLDSSITLIIAPVNDLLKGGTAAKH